MRNSATKKILVGLLAVILGCVAIFWVTVIYPINKFDREEKNSIGKFDALNKKIVEDLPTPPDGIEFIKMQQLGIEYPKPIHGRILVFYYSVPSYIDMTGDQILSYYQEILQLKGWEVSYEGGDQIEFKKNTACIFIDVYLPELDWREQIEITIWHDYLNQSFSLTLPDRWLLDLIDLGKTDIWICPYYGF